MTPQEYFLAALYSESAHGLTGDEQTEVLEDLLTQKLTPPAHISLQGALVMLLRAGNTTSHLERLRRAYYHENVAFQSAHVLHFLREARSGTARVTFHYQCLRARVENHLTQVYTDTSGYSELDLHQRYFQEFTGSEEDYVQLWEEPNSLTSAQSEIFEALLWECPATSVQDLLVVAKNA